MGKHNAIKPILSKSYRLLVCLTQQLMRPAIYGARSHGLASVLLMIHAQFAATHDTLQVILSQERLCSSGAVPATGCHDASQHWADAHVAH